MLKSRLLVAVGIVAVLPALARVPVRAQTDAKPVAFDAASIKPNKSGNGPQGYRVQRGGLFTATNATTQFLILTAYKLKRYELAADSPGWLTTDHFDVSARSPAEFASVASPQLLEALRALLADRFKLVVHRETRELPIYALVVARPGRLGPDLAPSDVDCAALLAASRAGTPYPSPNPCAVTAPGFSGGNFAGGSVTLSYLTGLIQLNVDRPVFDRTNLTGNYKARLRWNPTSVTPGSLDSSASAPDASDAPSIFTAVQEQLGLKLEPTTGPIDVLVIDHVEPPTPN